MTRTTRHDEPGAFLPADRPRVGPRAIVVSAMVLVFAMINFADKAVLGLAAVPLSRDLHLSAGTYGLVASSFFLLFSLASLGAGFVTNRVGARWVLLALALLWSVAQVPILIVPAVATLFTSRIALGAAEGPAAAVATHGVFQWFPPHRRGLPSTLYPVGAGLGVFLAAPLLTILISRHGWVSAFFALAVVGVVWALAWLLVGREGPYAAGPAEPETDRPREPHVAYRRLLTCPTWLGGAVGGFGAYWALAVGSAFVPPYLITQHHFSPAMAAAAVSLYALVSVIGPVVVGPLVSWFGNRGASSRRSKGVTQGAVVLVAGAALLALPHAGSTGPLYVLVAVAFGTVVIVWPLTYLTTGEITPVRQRGASFGALIAVQSLPGLFGPAVTGWLVDASGYALAFTVGGAIMVVCGVVAVAAINPERDAARLGLTDRFAAAPANGGAAAATS